MWPVPVKSLGAEPLLGILGTHITHHTCAATFPLLGGASPRKERASEAYAQISPHFLTGQGHTGLCSLLRSQGPAEPARPQLRPQSFRLNTEETGEDECRSCLPQKAQGWDPRKPGILPCGSPTGSKPPWEEGRGQGSAGGWILSLQYLLYWFLTQECTSFSFQIPVTVCLNRS